MKNLTYIRVSQGQIGFMKRFSLFSVLLLGCNSPVPSDIRIDCDLPIEYQEAALQAVVEWTDAVPELAASQVVITCDSPNVYVADFGTGTRAAQVVNLATGQGIEINQARIEQEHADIKRVLLHELGHFWGLAHLEDGTVMAASYYGVAETITEEDVAAMRRIWE